MMAAPTSQEMFVTILQAETLGFILSIKKTGVLLKPGIEHSLVPRVNTLCSSIRMIF